MNRYRFLYKKSVNQISTKSKAIQKTIEFIVRYHNSQFRDDGLPAVTHMFSVLKRLSDWGVKDQFVWQVALLHDVLEDTTCTFDMLARVFGKDIATAVQGLTFRDKQPGEESSHYQAYKSSELAKYDSKPIELLVVKVADRLSNTCDFMASKPDYAAKYLDRASGLFICMSKAEKAIINKFGSKVWLAMQDDYKNVAERAVVVLGN